MIFSSLLHIVQFSQVLGLVPSEWLSGLGDLGPGFGFISLESISRSRINLRCVYAVFLFNVDFLLQFRYRAWECIFCNMIIDVVV